MSRTLGLVLVSATLMLSACADVRPTAPDEAVVAQVRAASSGAQPLSVKSDEHSSGRDDDDGRWRDRDDDNRRRDRLFPRDTNAVARFDRNDRWSQESASARIGPRGGSVRLGDFEIIVPAGAVSQPTTFRIELPAESRHGLAIAEFSPHNTYFAVPVTVIMPYRTVRRRGPGSRVMWWSPAYDRWIALPSQLTSDGRLGAITNHLSFWAVDDGGLTTAGG